MRRVIINPPPPNPLLAPAATDPSKVGVTYEKIWGWMKPLYQDAVCRLVACYGAQGGYCSLHAHHFQSNIFIVQSGRLRIHIYGDPGTRITETILLDKSRTTYTAKPGARHRFEVAQDCHFTELYFGFYGRQPDEFDISREDQGGKKSSVVSGP